MSDTPRTDAMRLKMAQLGWPSDAEPVAMLMASHCQMERELAAERALADRLATWAQEHRNAYMGQVPHQDCGCGDCQILPVLDTDLAAWKEARRGAD